MARMQVDLPDGLYEEIKARGLPASKLLQKAVSAELRRLDLLAETDRYVADLIAEVGAPSAAQRKRAATVARRLSRRPPRQVV
jgi:post-segregation antitoxin (ccd killing protein)